MANKMAEKRKTTSRSSQVAQSRPRTSQKPVKTISEMARDEAAEARTVPQAESNTASNKAAKSAKDAKSQNVVAPPRDTRETATGKTENVASARTTRAAATTTSTRNEQRKPRRDAKQPSWFARIRRTRFGNFVYEAYYELRHKVTWPTFEEARNMTAVVIVLSAVIGAFLAAVDYGLYNLFLLISGGK